MRNHSTKPRKTSPLIPAQAALSASADQQPHIAPANDILLTEDELAGRWKLASAKKLQADRVKGVGCPFVRIGRCIRYRMSDVAAHEAANLRRSTTEG